MCFSAEASFAVGVGLLPAAGYCIYSAWRKRPSYLPLAVVPLFFSLQQLSEGLVWRGIEGDDEELIRFGSLGFLFFALALWPFWFSFVGAVTETAPSRRRLFIVLALFSNLWFWLLYFPLLLDADTYLRTSVVHHSIQYDYMQLPVYSYVSVWPLRLLYFLCVALPMAIGSTGIGHRPGLIFAAMSIVVLIIYQHAFVSVWCFFAALLTFYMVWIFHTLPYSKTAKTNVKAEMVGQSQLGHT